MRTGIVLRPMTATEGGSLRDIRVRAIRDTPDAFAVSLDETLAETDQGWTAWATVNAAGKTNIMYVAEVAGTWIGMAGGILDASRSHESVELISMCVDPAYRGCGLGRQLVDCIVTWAKDRGARRLELWVTETNEKARALYKRCGFRENEELAPLPSDPSFTEVQMVRDL